MSSNLKYGLLKRMISVGVVGCVLLSFTSCISRLDDDARQLAAETYARRQLQREYNNCYNAYIDNFSNLTPKNKDSAYYKSITYREQMVDLTYKMSNLKNQINAINNNIGAITSEYSQKYNSKQLYELNKEMSAISTTYYR